MCGIIGRIGAHPGPWDERRLAALRHRGPDEQSHAVIGPVRLGHTRLSIIDLSGGSQPMQDAEGLATIVFNGEIYNHAALRRELEARGHRFLTHSDTEAILACYLTWGIQGFARLRGMYALALHDHRDGATILARDPFGIKPLFVSRASDGVYFASEQAALIEMMEIRPELDLTSVLETLVHRHPMGEHSLYRNVERLAPGCALKVAKGAYSLEQVRFTSLPDAVERHREEAARASEAEAEARIVDSIRHHAIADVPVGCFLSGGLDSSIVAQALTEDTAGPLKAYSVGFRQARHEQSELPFARAVARHIGADLHELQVGPDDFAELGPVLSGSLNGPFPDPADIAMLKLSRAARPDVKVVLTGEGSDEAFAGYPKYAADRYACLLGWPMRLLDRRLGRRGRLGIAARAMAQADRPRRWMNWFENDEVPSSIVQSLLAGGADPDRAITWTRERAVAYPAGWSDMQRMQMLDLEAWLPNNLLHRGDYTTMQASLEQRVPLLDIELTPWAVALPDRLKVKRLRGKMILRRTFERKLPPEVIKRRKSGFRLPLGEWLRDDKRLRDLAHDRLVSANSALRDYLSLQEAEQILSPDAVSTGGGAKLAWTTICLEFWLRSLSVQSQLR